jgi:two-component system KDP operon response regulator KdpE
MSAHFGQQRAYRSPPDDGRGAKPRTSVLILDPDAEVRATLRIVLEAIRLHVLEAATAEEAQALLATNRIDVALLEVNLPQCPGDVLAAEMAKAGVVPLLMSGSAYGIARAQRTGLTFLRKPVTQKDVLKAVILSLPAWYP